MISINKIIQSLKTSEEQAFLLSFLGFLAVDQCTINKLGGIEPLLASDISAQKLAELVKARPAYERFLVNLRDRFDSFYEQGGGFLFAQELPQLQRVKQSPLVFMVRFNANLLFQQPSVAIVGSRKADRNALNRAATLSKNLAQQGVTIVSGGAMGTDYAAHEGALFGGGATIVISGMVCSFKNYELGARLKNLGQERIAVLYPYGPHIPQANYMFVQRNQFVAALSEHVVIVQGEKGSGTLHTARFAKKLGVPIYAFSEDPSSALSYAPHYLIEKKAAQALVDDQEFVKLVTGKAKKICRLTEPVKKPDHKELPKLALVFKQHALKATVAELMHWSGLSFLELQKELLTLELSGMLRKKGALYELV